MQPVNAKPRPTNTTFQQLQGLLQCMNPAITYGATLLYSDFSTALDLTPYMSGGSSVTSDITSTTHRSCSLYVDSSVYIGPNYFVQPWMTVTNNETGYSATFNLGVYTLQSPQSDNSKLPSVLNYTGYDLLYYLNQPIGDSYEVPAGVDPVAAAASLVGSVSPNFQTQYEPSNVVTPTVRSYPYDPSNEYTYLTVVNDLLALANYVPVWVDWDGTFQMHAFVDPNTLAPEYTFDITGDEKNVISEDRTSNQDFFDIPNWWRFVMQNVTSTPVEGTSQFTYQDNTNNSTSFKNRGFLVKKLYTVDVPDFPTLMSKAFQQINDDLSPAETFSLYASPFPLFWHRDIVLMVDKNLGFRPGIYGNDPTQRNCMVMGWTLYLDGSQDMELTFQTINILLSAANFT